MGAPDAGSSLPDNRSVVSHRDRPAAGHQPGALPYSLDAPQWPVAANARSPDPSLGGPRPGAARRPAGRGGVPGWGLGVVPTPPPLAARRSVGVAPAPPHH